MLLSVGEWRGDWRHRLWLSDGFPQQIDRARLERWIAESPKVFKHDRTTTVALVKVGTTEIIVKRYNARNMGHRIKRLLRSSRAVRCLRMSAEFEQAGLNVATPLAMYESRFGPFRFNAYFVTAFLPGEELINILPDSDELSRDKLLVRIRQAFDAMRIHKLSHGDCKATNLLWSKDRLYFIDLDAARKHSSGFTWRHAHRKDIKRFLKNWSRHPDLLQLFRSLQTTGG